MREVSSKAQFLCCTAFIAIAWLGGPVGVSAQFQPSLPKPFQDSDFPEINEEEIRLGQALFYDPIMSGNRNVSCADCHHPALATGDSLSLGIGEGGIGLGLERSPDPDNLPEQRIPRNAQPLYNVGALQMQAMFFDGRVERDESKKSGLRTPLGEEMTIGFDSLLSAQTMFPVLSADEMAGHYGENEISQAIRKGLITGENGAWSLIAHRVAQIPEYREMFQAVYGLAPDAIKFTDISNAIAAFVAFEWRSDNSAFDQYLRDEAALDADAMAGLELFYGEAGCADCHSGTLLSDQNFHNTAQPQIGPGKAERFESHQRDTGRMRVTGNPEDAYAFRTPPLRNVTETGPWGHSGAYSDLRAFLEQHSNPREGFRNYEPQAELPWLPATAYDFTVMENEEETAKILETAADVPPLDEREIDLVLAFLDSLLDQSSIDGRLGVPDQVPSGLAMQRISNSSTAPNDIPHEITPDKTEEINQPSG